MGDVMIVYKVMPEGPETGLDRIKEDIKEIAEEYGTFKGSKEEKVAFGLKAIVAKIVIPDEGGIVDEMEEKLNNIENIQSAESEDITLID
ncbi:MAG: elongation factor 1-beta [Candidatus Thermoplasmatota archaeon]